MKPHSQKMRERAMSILHRLAPDDYHRALARETEVETIAKNAGSVGKVIKGLCGQVFEAA